MPRTIQIHNMQDCLRIDPASVESLVEFVLETEGVPSPLEVSFRVVDDTAMAALNARYLNRPEPTDVLAFAMNESEPAAPKGEMVLGDVVVSAERALLYCREHGGEPIEELALYVVHGLLHLLGYDDLEEPARTCMQERERLLLQRAREAGIALRA